MSAAPKQSPAITSQPTYGFPGLASQPVQGYAGYAGLLSQPALYSQPYAQGVATTSVPITSTQNLQLTSTTPPANPPPNLPADARFVGSYTDPNTQVTIDKYVIPKQHVQPVQTVEYETQEKVEYIQTFQDETQYIQVPIRRMIPKEVTEIITVPEDIVETRTVVVPKTIQQEVKQTYQVPKVHHGHEIHESAEIYRVERPRVVQQVVHQQIPGKVAVASIGPQHKGVQWTHVTQGTPVPLTQSQQIIVPSQQATTTSAAGIYTTQTSPAVAQAVVSSPAYATQYAAIPQQQYVVVASPPQAQLGSYYVAANQFASIPASRPQFAAGTSPAPAAASPAGGPLKFGGEL